MLIPRYSLRTLLIATAACALFSLVVADAVRGKPWAIGMTAALSALGVVFLLHPLAFAMAALFASVRKQLTPPPQGTSPFASAGPPRQIVRPSPPPQ